MRFEAGFLLCLPLASRSVLLCREHALESSQDVFRRYEKIRAMTGGGCGDVKFTSAIAFCCGPEGLARLRRA